MAAFTTNRSCQTKTKRPTSAAALALAADIAGESTGSNPVIELSVYQAHIDQRNGEGACLNPFLKPIRSCQQLRGHLAYLKLTAVTEAIPAQLDASEPARPAMQST